MANDTSTQVDVGLLSEMADTCEKAARSFQAQVPYAAKLPEINMLKDAGFSTTKAEVYDDSIDKYAAGLTALAGSIRGYVASVNGNDEKIEEEMPEEESTVEDNNQSEVSTNMEEGKTDDVEESKMDAEEDAKEVSSGDNKDGKSGNYDDGTKDETKDDLDNINKGDETEQQDYKDDTDDNDKKDLTDPNKKKKKTPLPEDIVTQFFEKLSDNQISVILQAMNSGETEEITLEQIIADEKYLTKLRNILKNDSSINQNTLNALGNLDNSKLKSILLKTIGKSGISTAASATK